MIFYFVNVCPTISMNGSKSALPSIGQFIKQKLFAPETEKAMTKVVTETTENALKQGVKNVSDVTAKEAGEIIAEKTFKNISDDGAIAIAEEYDEISDAKNAALLKTALAEKTETESVVENTIAQESNNNIKEQGIVENKLEQESTEELIAAKKAEEAARIEEEIAEGADAAGSAANAAANETEIVTIGQLIKAKLAEAAARAKAFFATPLGIATAVIGVTALTAALTAGAVKFYKWITSADHAIKKSQKVRKEAFETADALKKEADTAFETSKNFSQLVEQLQDLVEGSEEYYEVANKIAELDPTVVLGYTSNGDAIIDDVGALEEQAKVLRQITDEKREAAKFEAQQLISTDLQQYKSLKTNKEKAEAELEERKKAYEEAVAYMNSLPTNSGDYDIYAGEGGRVAQAKDEYEEAVKELKKYSDELYNLDSEILQNYSYLFDEFDDSMSDAQKEAEKQVRKFTVEIAKRAKLKPEQFQQLYTSAEAVNDELFEELFSLDDSDLTQDEYIEKAQILYDNIVKALLDKGFSLDDKGRVGLKVLLGIDDTALANNRQRTNSFADKNFAGYMNAAANAAVRGWYDALSGEEKDIVDKAADFGDKVREAMDADKDLSYTDAFNQVLESIKEADKAAQESKSLKELMKLSTGKDEEGKDKTFKDDIDNFNSKLSSVGEYLNKLKDGTYTDTDVSSIAAEFGVAAEDTDELITKLEKLCDDELEKLIKQIDELDTENLDPEAKLGLEQIRKAALATTNQVKELDNTLKQTGHTNSDILGSKVGMDKLAAIYKDILDGGEFDWTSIINNSEFREMFGHLEGYQELIDGIFVHPKNYKANKKAFDNLVDSYLKGEKVLQGLNEEEKLHAKRLLESMGVTNADEMIEAELTSKRIDNAIKAIQADEKKREAAADALKLEKSRADFLKYCVEQEERDIAALFAKGGALEKATEAEKAYFLEQKFQEEDFVSQDIDQLDAIVKALGLGCEAWDAYYDYRKQLADAEQNNTGAAEIIRKQLKAELDNKLKAVQAEMGNLAESYETDLDDAGTEAADAYLDAFNKELGELDKLKDVGIISEKEYLDRLRALYIKYFADKKKYYAEFKQYEKQYLEGVKSLYESAISAAITLLNDQKDELEKAKDDAVKVLEEERDAQKKIIQERLDALEKERDELQKANEQRERALNLQKAQYELERAHSQRTRLIKIYVRSYSNIA